MLIFAAPGHVCLDYANTLSWRGRETPAEKLYDLADVIGWIEIAAGMAGPATREIRDWSREHRKKAARMFAEAITMREVIFRIFSAFAAGEAVRSADFDALRRALADAPGRCDLASLEGRYAWRIERLDPAMPALLAPVLWSAGDLMLAAGQRLIRRCANPDCLWLFVDESRNGTRRWCDMTSCGNRAKARRHYAKVRQA